MNKTSIIIALVVLLAALSFVGGIFTHRAFSRSAGPQIDTVYLSTHTEQIDHPFPVSREPAPESIPSVTIKKEELLPTKDTATVQVRPTVSTFTDTLPSGASYKIQTSGIGTAIENISLSWPEKNILKTVPFKGWTVDAVGQGLLTDFSKEGVSGFVGVQVGYTSDRFSFGIGPGALWSRPPGAASHQTSLALTMNVKVNLYRFRK